MGFKTRTYTVVIESNSMFLTRIFEVEDKQYLHWSQSQVWETFYSWDLDQIAVSRAFSKWRMWIFEAIEIGYNEFNGTHVVAI